MTAKPTGAAIPDPVATAAANAPLDERSVSDDERRAIDAAKARAAAGGKWCSGEEVSAAIASGTLDALLRRQ